MTDLAWTQRDANASYARDSVPTTASAFAELGAAFGEMLDTVTFNVAAAAAFAALLDNDDATAQALAGLDAEQLQRIENAAVALSLHASRLRRNRAG